MKKREAFVYKYEFTIFFLNLKYNTKNTKFARYKVVISKNDTHRQRILQLEIELIRNGQNFHRKLVQFIVAQKRKLIVHLCGRIRLTQQAKPIGHERVSTG